MPASYSQWPAPAQPGMRVDEIDTPALVLDMPSFERNLDRMAGFAREKRLRLRPHAKMHKTPAVALEQIRRGAVGVCCQKVSEAAAMIQGGVGDVLVTNEVVGAPKLARLAALAREARVGVCVDALANIEDLGAAARAAGAMLDVYIELDVGARRCGTADPAFAVELARRVGTQVGLRLMGLQAYQGSAQHLRAPAERRAAIEEAARLARETRDLLEAAGLPCPIITGAGTGTYMLEGGSGVWNELQPGSYAFMDADYARNTTDAPFEHSLTLLASVISSGGVRDGAAPVRAVLDAGLKASSVDSGLPVLAGAANGDALPGLEYVRPSDEHGILVSRDGAPLPRPGSKVRLIPGHIDPTVNLHDWIVCVRDGRVENVWPVAARGAMW